MTRTFFAAAGRTAGVMLLIAACGGETSRDGAPQSESAPAATTAGTAAGTPAAGPDQAANVGGQPTPVRNRPATSAPGDTMVTVTGPMVIAFYHVDRIATEVEPATFRISDPSEQDLANFEYHLPRQQSALGGLGWRLIILYRADFRAVDSDGTVLGSPEMGDDGSAGYMVVAPGTPARVRYGVLDAEELTAFVQAR